MPSEQNKGREGGGKLEKRQREGGPPAGVKGGKGIHVGKSLKRVGKIVEGGSRGPLSK